MKLPTSWKPRRKKRDELIRQGENELEAARAKARALTQQVESQAYALTDELRQLQKDERMSTQQKAQRAREIAKKRIGKAVYRLRGGA